MKVSLSILPVLWAGCVGQSNIADKSTDPENHLHSIEQTQAFGDQHYHAVMKYDDREGFISIDFSNANEDPVKILGAKNIKALLTLPDGKSKELYFRNLEKKRYPPEPQEDKNQLQLKPLSETIYTEREFLKNLSAFTLKAWLPVNGTTFVLKYEYSDPRDFYIPHDLWRPPY
jgi:hypothetical protein